MYVKWYDPYLEDTCHGTYTRGVCIFGVEDLPDVITRKEFFLNKFYESFEPLALDCMEAWLDYKDNCRPPFDHTFYESLPFINRL